MVYLVSVTKYTITPLCVVDLESTANQTITDIALQNSGSEDVELPPGSSLVIGVNSIHQTLNMAKKVKDTATKRQLPRNSFCTSR